MMLRCLVLLTSCLLCGAGCQRYAPHPLDLDAHGLSVRERHPASPGVADYARKFMGVDNPSFTRYDPADGLSLDEAEIVALFFNPRLRTARLAARVPTVGAAEAGRWEDPALQVDAERIIESVPNPWVLGGMFNVTIPLSGRLRAGKDKALAEANVERLRVVAAEQELLVELRATWLDWSSLLEQALVTRAMLRELDDFARAADKLRAAGELGPLDARLFQIERLTRSGKLLTIEADVRDRELRLRSTLGLVPDAGVTLVPSLTAANGSPPLAPDAKGLVENHPRLRVARAEYEVAERALRLEIRRQYPDLALGRGFGTDEGTERVLGGFGLPLPLWNANRRAIAEARAARDAARAAAEGQYEQLLHAAAQSKNSLDAAAARLRFVEEELGPLVDDQLAAARQLGRLGDSETLVLLEAVKASYDARFEVLEARRRLALAAVRASTLVEPGDSGSIGKERP